MASMACGEATRKGDRVTIDPVKTKPDDVPELRAEFEKRMAQMCPAFDLQDDGYYWRGPTFAAWRGFLAGIVYERGL